MSSKETLAAQKESGQILLVAHVVRFWGEYVSLVEFVQSGKLGKPLSAAALFTRISAVIERPRQFVRVGEFFGPDRRRRKEDYAGDERRGKNQPRPGEKPSPQAPMSQNEINQLFNP